MKSYKHLYHVVLVKSVNGVIMFSCEVNAWGYNKKDCIERIEFRYPGQFVFDIKYIK